MMRGATLAVALLLACAPSRPPATPGTSPERSTALVNAIADEFLPAFFDFVPEYATFIVAPGPWNAKLTDASPANIRRWQSSEDRWLERLRTIPAASLEGTPAAVTYGILRETLESSWATRVCRAELWRADQLQGWQVSVPHLGQLQALGSPEARAAALARWADIPRLADRNIANLREGVRLGYTAPQGNVQAVIQQLDELLRVPADSSPFALMAKRDSTPEFRAMLIALVASEVTPALQRYRTYLVSEYLPAARTTVGLSALPDGDACYRARIRQSTTLELDPKAVHELGLAQMEHIEGEMRTIAQRSFGTSDIRGLLQQLRRDTAYTFHSREEVIATAESAIARATRAMPQWFGRLPKAAVEVDPCLPFQEASACPNSYEPPSENRPGRYRINAGSPTTKPRAPAEGTAFHEVIPGHHLQVAIALERPGAHPVTRYLFNSGFVEGWALYAERLVVDPGIQALGWSRQQAIDYMLAHTALALRHSCVSRPGARGRQRDARHAAPKGRAMGPAGAVS
jgi:uncharacterized protein (DUF885 family)